MSEKTIQPQGKNQITNGAKSRNRKYGLDKLLEIDPFFLAPGELEGAKAAHEQLSKLLEGSLIAPSIERKSFVQGAAHLKTKDGYYVDLGGKYDGFVPLDEQAELTLGEQKEFYVMSAAQADSGSILSSTVASGWRQLEAAQRSGVVLQARVFSQAMTKRNRKSAGLRLVFEEGPQKGIRGFVPNTQISRNIRPESLIDQVIDVVVLTAEADKGSDYGNLVLSQKAAQQHSDDGALSILQTNSLVKGEIIGFIKAGVKDTKKSALVKLKSGLVGLLHRSETAGEQDNLTELYKEGDTIEVAVRIIDLNKKRLSLSLKLAEQLKALSTIERGSVVSAKILRTASYGYFASIGGRLEGLIHESDLATVGGRRESFKPGDSTEVVVISFNPDGSRLALGRKSLLEWKRN